MEEKIFREKSMERVSSPEQLDDYIRVTSPGVWMVMGAVVLLLAGVCVWGIFGRLDTVIKAPAVVKDGTIFCYIREADREQIAAGMEMEIKGKGYPILSVSERGNVCWENETRRGGYGECCKANHCGIYGCAADAQRNYSSPFGAYESV